MNLRLDPLDTDPAARILRSPSLAERVLELRAGITALSLDSQASRDDRRAALDELDGALQRARKRLDRGA